jgi:hypothetical protein
MKNLFFQEQKRIHSYVEVVLKKLKMKVEVEVEVEVQI